MREKAAGDLQGGEDQNKAAGNKNQLLKDDGAEVGGLSFSSCLGPMLIIGATISAVWRLLTKSTDIQASAKTPNSRRPMKRASITLVRKFVALTTDWSVSAQISRPRNCRSKPFRIRSQARLSRSSCLQNALAGISAGVRGLRQPLNSGDSFPALGPVEFAHPEYPPRRAGSHCWRVAPVFASVR